MKIINTILSLGTILLMAGAAVPATDNPPRVFAPGAPPATTSPLAALGSPPPASVQRRLDPDFAAAGASWRAGQQFRLDLLDHQDITFEVTSVETTSEGAVVLEGRSSAQEDSTGTLSLDGNELNGLLHLPGLGHYLILPLNEPGLHEVRRLEVRRPGFCLTDPLTASEIAPAARQNSADVGKAGPALPPADTLPEPTVLDLLFVYTPQALIAEGSEAGIHRRIRESVDDTNRRFQMSDINVRVNLLHIAPVNYADSGNITTDVLQLANGQVSGVSGLRADYKADLVVMVTELENSGAAGVAIDLPPSRGEANVAFTVVLREVLGGQNSVLAHELGHLLGCAHDREHSGDVNSDYYRNRKPYIFGHRLVVEGVTYVSLMGYRPGIELPQFSNPRLTLDGVPLGVPNGQARPADGARTVNEIAPYVSRYRQALSRVSFSAKRTSVPENGGEVTLGLERTGDLNTSTRVTVVVEANSTAKPGLDFTLPVGTKVEFATNQATAHLVIPLRANDATEGERTLRLRLTSVVGLHGLGTDATTEVVILDAGTPASFSEVEFPDGPLSVPESAGTARVRVAYTGPFDSSPGESIVLPWRTEDNSAVAGQDFQAASGTVTFTPESSTQEIGIPVLPRPEAGPDRSLRLIVGTKTNEIRLVDEQRHGTLLGARVADLGSSIRSIGLRGAAVRGDGKLLIWGGFARVGETDQTGLALLNTDGSPDPSFRPPTFLLGHRWIELAGRSHPNAIIHRVLVLPDNRMLVAGQFSRVGGTARISLVRLQADGTLDDTFGPGLTFDGRVTAVARQGDGKILVGGDFERINEVRRSFLWRLNEDGTVDESFKPRGGPTSSWTAWVSTIAVQTDGRILIGGGFERVDGKVAVNLARLNPDGTLDTSFKLPATGVSGPVDLIQLQPDGRILLAGLFDSVGARGNTRKLARLNADGTVDTTFKSPNPNAWVGGLTSLPDGRLMVSGGFTVIGRQNRRFVARLLEDGSVDPSFDLGTGPDDFPGYTLPVDADGTLHLIGDFKHVNGLPAANLARIRFGDVPPVLTGTSMEPDGTLRTVVNGLPGGAYAVETGDSLGQWAPAGELRFQGYDQSAPFTAPASEADGQFIRLTPMSP